jgi:hypothetical protein
MTYRETEHLRVLIANERKDRLALVASTVATLGLGDRQGGLEARGLRPHQRRRRGRLAELD